ncbi:uridine phosphorylase 2-like [Ctenocephalides felis]|uniref:uridine phosphorylase 2-like n=1 Tax=Ctenocephalides felis TaxID=7515 RepID=UPI000E6E522B|nr:uridine phosphorylase 2-like [Ctenocephalides felis]
MSFQNGKYSNGNRKGKSSVILKNPHLHHLDQDVLYHLALGTGSHDFEKMFGDIKFVCMGGTANRMETFAKYMLSVLDIQLPTGSALYDMIQSSHRYSMYKVGPVLCVNHGMGVPSLSILLNEVMKLLHYAGAKDPIMFRIGTSGGIGVDPGTVVISNKAVDGLCRQVHEMYNLGKVEHRPAILDENLAKDIQKMAQDDDPFQTVLGTTMCAHDFYEGQGRLDGAFCSYTESEKTNFLEQLFAKGVRNIEMESTVFSAFTHHANVRAAIVNVTIVNRLEGDQIRNSKQQLLEYQDRPQIIVGRYIKKCLQSQ